MKTATSLITLFILFLSVDSDEVQSQNRLIEVEVEPVAYVFDGAGIHGRYMHDNWRYSVEILGLKIPKSLHGNDGLEARTKAVELHFERFLNNSAEGFFIGPEAGISNFEVTHKASGESRDRIQYSVGLRSGYKWYTGLGDLYLAPVAGVVYTLNSEDIEIRDEVFESGPATPFVTVGIGWSFEL